MKSYIKFIIIINIILFNIYIQKKFRPQIKINILKNGRKYLDKCLQDKSNKRIFYSKQNPKISVIIPVYNCEKSIKSSIISIQNQKMTNFEIILVNDFSKDNSKYILENIQQSDSRLIIINNNKNMGTLYSRSIGVLASKGQYIFALDNDDLIFNKNLFNVLYKNVKNDKYDILGFKVIYGSNYNSNIYDMFDEPFIKQKNNIVIYQPELKFFSIKNNDVHIWGKLIKNEIYKNAVNSLGIKRYSIYLCNAEDDVIIFLLFIKAKSFKFIPYYGLFHLISNNTASFTLSKNHILFSKLFYLDILIDFTNNDFKEKEYVIYNLYLLKNIFLSKINLNTYNKNFLKLILNKIYKNKFITNSNKKNIIKMFKNITI